MPLSNLAFYRYKYILPIGFSLIIALMVLTSLAAAIQLKNSSEIMITSVKEHGDNDRLLKTMAQSALKRSITIFEMLNTDDPFELDELYMHLNELATTFTVAREEFQDKDLDPQMQILFDKQGQIARMTAPRQIQVYEFLLQEQKEKAVMFFKERTLPNSKIFLDLIKEMTDIEASRAQAAFQQSKRENDMVLFSILVFDLASILFSIFLTVYVIKKQRANDRKLAVLANTDILTDLPNRSSFIKTIKRCIKEEPSSIFAIVYFDIDYFKSINDNYGHEIGDEILRRFSAEIKGSLNKVDVLSRFGGDEFVLLLRSIRSEKEARRFVSKLSLSLDTSLFINNNEIFISASIGVTLYSQDGRTPKKLLKNADFAMYTAKKSGRNCYQFFSKGTSDRMEKEHDICHALRSILENRNPDKELFLMYQPLLDIDNGGVTECEALIRWTNLEGQTIPPDEFISLAEKSNLIEKVNLFVINEACKQQSEWQQTGAKDIRININLSGNKIIFNKLLKQFKRNIVKLCLSPTLFGIELTERTLHEISQDTINELDELREQGVKISIDDFGTGYSSLSYLKKLPITTLKIDKEFISGLPDDKDDHALVKAIITLGHSLNLDVVAEGVETYEQLKFLRDHSCNIAQGYYFQRPLDCKQMSELSQLKLVA